MKGPAWLVEVASAAGSTPRDADAWMLVSKDRTFATIGGGQLEFMAIDHARKLVSGAKADLRMAIPLGPEIGQLLRRPRRASFKKGRCGHACDTHRAQRR